MYLSSLNAVVTGQMYRDPKHMDCSEMETQNISVECLNTNEEKPSEKPPQLPAQMIIPPQPTENQQPQASKKAEVFTKLNPPFKKYQSSDPPGSHCYNLFCAVFICLVM